MHTLAEHLGRIDQMQRIILKQEIRRFVIVVNWTDANFCSS